MIKKRAFMCTDTMGMSQQVGENVRIFIGS